MLFTLGLHTCVCIYAPCVTYIHVNMYVAKGEKLAPQPITDVCIFFSKTRQQIKKKKTLNKSNTKNVLIGIHQV